MQKFLVSISLSAVAAMTLAAAPGKTDSVTIPMKALNGSGESGTATLTQQDEGVQVVVELKNASKADQPTHIHAGTCDNINKAPEYALRNTVDGKSTSLVKGVKLADLTSGKYAINVHKSADDLGTYVACGDIKQ